jgi:transposase
VTFKAFADYWGFEPRLCRAYRPRTKRQASYCSSFRLCDAHWG